MRDAQRLMHDRFAQLRRTQRSFLAKAAGVCVVAPAAVFSVVAGMVPVRWASFSILAGFACGLFTSCVLLPFVAVLRERWWLASRRTAASARLWELISAARGGDRESQVLLRACAAYLLSSELGHVSLADGAELGDAELIGGFVAAGAAGGLALGVLADPHSTRPESASEAFWVAEVADTQPGFGLLASVVTEIDDPYLRSLRISRSFERAARFSDGVELLVALAPHWDGSLDELDTVVSVLASNS